MRTKTLLFLFLLTFGALNAQDTIRTLVISEARLDDAREGYAELTNVGADTINLAEFEFGIIGAWTSVTPAWVFSPGANYYVMLPDRKLAPGKSFIIAAVYDWRRENYMKNPEMFGPPNWNKKEFWTLADMQCDFPESPTGAASDNITPYYHIMEVWSGRDCFYVRHHVSATDSVVVDQVNGVFPNNNTRAEPKLAMDVAGMTNATNEATLVRKFSVKQGNLDFETGRGQDLAESEWMPVPRQLGSWEMDRKLFWTAGNHGDYNLDEATLTSTTVEINWTDAVITVPWGVRRDDSVMMAFDKKPGLAWHYEYVAAYEDSAYTSARTGDTLTVYACGNELDMVKFAILLAEPTADANVVMPKIPADQDGFFAGQGGAYAVSDGIPEMDTIGSSGMIGFGIEYGTRVDTLQKYLEKAPNASWEIVWVDGNERTDLKDGDILKVTAENNTSIKNYYIKVNEFRATHNAFLSSITWPDIPVEYRGVFGWMGDTVPGFSNNLYNYIVQVPADVDGVPALVAKSEDMNAKIAVDRVLNLYGSAADKTVTFTVTAEDDTTVREYAVQLEKEKAPAFIQPYSGEPFFSQWVWNEQWANNYLEVVNPGNQELDLSNYMFCWGYVNDPASAISRLANPTAADWANRYQKYIPGYKWEDSTNWKIEPVIAKEDLSINPIVQPGDVFTMGHTNSIGQAWAWGGGYENWFVAKQLDIDFGNNYNPWDEPIGGSNALNQWWGANYYLFRIDNDSVQRSLKPATDPNDFTLLDVLGSGDGNPPIIGGFQIQQINGYVRKPEIYLGQTEFNGSSGTDAETSEWIFTDRPYYQARGANWPWDILWVAQGLGSHFMNEVTIYKSTVTSLAYLVSQGYSMDELIKGVVTGTTVTDFLANVMAADTGQTLTLKSGTTSNILVGDSVLMDNDTLIVLSADLKNTTQYALDVTDEGLSGDALLTSATLTIAVNGEEGQVSGFNYGTTLKAVVDSVIVPAGAAFNVIDADGAYVPFTMLNFDTLYVDVLVNNQTYFEVIAENGVDKIVYQLTPTSTSSDAFVTSSVFAVDDQISLIDLIPEGITPFGLLANLIPATGATLQLVDKLGYERMFGNVVKDDKLIVTAQDGTTTRTYYLKMLGDLEVAFAYVVSDVYVVDQIAFTITGATDATLVSAFVGNLLPAEGATVVITDALGTVKTTGKLRPGDLVVVTASDGLTTNTYLIDVVLSINNSINDKIAVYPNPSRGLITVSGMEVGNRIQVTNMLGMRVYEKVAVTEKESVSLESQRNGVYFITISNDKDLVGRYKVVKE